MKLNYSFQNISSIISDSDKTSDAIIQSISFDTRKIIEGKSTLFVALPGVFKDGHSFLNEAYQKGVKCFLVSQKGATSHLKNAEEIVVPNTLEALEQFAQYHREKFSCAVVAITGSNGKTTVKEWLAELLSPTFTVSKSPKSYNSRLGIALSLLEITDKTQVAIIEAGVDEMDLKRSLIQPTHGILTSFGSAHRELFNSKESHFKEKIALFSDLEEFNYCLSEDQVNEFSDLIQNGNRIDPNELSDFLIEFSGKDNVSQQNVSLAITMALQLGVSKELIQKRLSQLTSLALRMESYDGKNGNVILNDTYNLDFDSLKHSLEYQQQNYPHLDRVAVIGVDKTDHETIDTIKNIINSFSPIEVLIKSPGETIQADFKNTCILIKGTRKSKMEKFASSLKKYNHQSYLEINLKSIRHNINYYKSLIKKETKLLCMVKASSYGSDAKTMGRFLENMGVDYLGVAYPNEGIELRSKGIKTPILVMNCEEQLFAECIKHNLEPAIYSLNQLDAFIKTLINYSIVSYSIHVKLETGMNRLGFSENEISSLIRTLKSQPEVKVASIYSHLAESNVLNSEYTKEQIYLFSSLCKEIADALPYSFLKHILNTEGISNYPESQMDMVRLGIGMYGVNENVKLRPAIALYSSISQIKEIKKGESVGYGQAFKSTDDMRVAIAPIGYADGIRRSLGNNCGGVYVDNQYCSIIGNICMDMIMIDVSSIDCSEGDKVEIIGENQSVQDLAKKMGTITYEVLTSFSSRLHRIYADQ